MQRFESAERTRTGMLTSRAGLPAASTALTNDPAYVWVHGPQLRIYNKSFRNDPCSKHTAPLPSSPHYLSSLNHLPHHLLFFFLLIRRPPRSPLFPYTTLSG